MLLEAKMELQEGKLTELVPLFPQPGTVVLCQLGHKQLWKTFIAHAYNFKYSRTMTSNAYHRSFALVGPKHNDNEQ